MYAPGTPCWIDLSSPDVQESTRFYTGLYGWTAMVATEPEAGGYTTFQKDGQAVAAVGGQMSPDQPVYWTTYFASADADATASRVEAGGGKVLMAPMDVMGYGRMAVFTDPAGAVFAVWQAGSMQGFDVKGVPGSLSWVELMTRDVEASKTFYRTALGLEGRDVQFDGATYTIWQAAEQDVAGMMPVGEMWPADLPPHWMVYFEVEDTDATAEQVGKLGGMVSVSPTDTAAGRFAVVSDPHGAFFSIIKSSPDFQP